jgi:hypothetical protein
MPQTEVPGIFALHHGFVDDKTAKGTKTVKVCKSCSKSDIIGSHHNFIRYYRKNNVQTGISVQNHHLDFRNELCNELHYKVHYTIHYIVFGVTVELSGLKSLYYRWSMERRDLLNIEQMARFERLDSLHYLLMPTIVFGISSCPSYPQIQSRSEFTNGLAALLTSSPIDSLKYLNVNVQ